MWEGGSKTRFTSSYFLYFLLLPPGISSPNGWTQVLDGVMDGLSEHLCENGKWSEGKEEDEKTH